MKIRDYTSDAICQAMGLGMFQDPSWMLVAETTMRVVLTPSFHPELCFTLGKHSESAYLSIVVLTEQFWASRENVYHAQSNERVLISAEAFLETIAKFEAANVVGPTDPSKRYVTLDGMNSHFCLISSARQHQLSAHVSTSPNVNRFVSHLLQVAWTASSNARVRNALAAAARYVALDFPLQEVPSENPTIKLLVIGSPEERSEYFASLEKNKDGDRPQSHPSN